MSMWFIVPLCVVYVAGWLSAARFVLSDPDADIGDGLCALGMAGFIGALWSLATALAIVLAPFIGIGGLATRGRGDAS